MASNAKIVWSAEDGWHDGERVVVALDESGRLVTSAGTVEASEAGAS